MNENIHPKHDAESGSRAASRALTRRPPTSDAPSSNDTVHMTINGLAVLCTDHGSGQVEIGFVREHHSALQIRVRNRATNRIVLQHDCVAGERSIVEIHRVNANGVGLFYQDDSSTTRPDNDFRWMPDLAILHPNGVSIRANAWDALTAKLVIKDATFYTARRSQRAADITDAAGNVHYLSGRIGDLLGAYFSDPRDEGILVRVSVNSPGDRLDETLRRQDGPFDISVETIPHSNTGDHMPVLYSDVIDTQGQFTIAYHPRGMTTEYACQPLPDGDGPIG